MASNLLKTQKLMLAERVTYETASDPDSPAGSEHDVVERALIGSGVVLAADFEARRIGEHAMDLFLGRSRVPVPAPPGRGRELH